MGVRLIYNQRSEGGHLLAGMLAELPVEGVVSWGVPTPGVIGGQARVGGYEQLQRFIDRDLLAPAITRNIVVARKWVMLGQETWGRRDVHSHGSDIRFVGQRGWSTSDFWVERVLGVVREWRIHVWGERVIGRGLKHRVERHIRGAVIRSRKYGWRLRHDVEPPEVVREVARRMVEILEYPFGACDILETEGGMYALEVNRAPGLDDYTAGRYARAIERHFREG